MVEHHLHVACVTYLHNFSPLISLVDLLLDWVGRVHRQGKAIKPGCHLCRRGLDAGEPMLLVGETGTGKTTVCQLAAAARGQPLHMLNCNQHTETADFLGGFRPARWAI